jgi:CheY-like chemotaxis protein
MAGRRLSFSGYSGERCYAVGNVHYRQQPQFFLRLHIKQRATVARSSARDDDAHDDDPSFARRDQSVPSLVTVGDTRGSRMLLKPSLRGRHILIVEDEMLIALSLTDIVTALGCTSVMVSRVAKAVAIAATQKFDAAILDMNLAGEPGYPVAEALSRYGIPFIISSGYGTEYIVGDHRDRPRLPKPYLPEQVEAALLKVLAI